MATMQELIEQWKKEAAQSQTVTGKDIPWVGMYQAQNDEHRAYDTNSALETAQQNQSFLNNLNAQTQAMNNEAHKIQTDRAAIQTVRDLGNLDVRVNGDLGVYDNAWKTLQAQRANIDMNRLAELSDIFTKAEAEHGAIPFSYKSTHWENPYLSLSDADKQIIQNYIQANKDRTDLTDNEKKTLQAFTRAYARAGEQGINTANVGNNTRSDLANTINSFAGGFASFNQPLVNFLAKGVNKLPILNQISDDQIASGQIQANQMLKNAQEQNPKAYEAGRGAGQIYDYLITSALTNGALDKLGLGTKGAFAANQALQLAQDLGLDILPEAQRMQKEEGEINWGKLLYKTAEDAGLNLAMGIAPTLVGTSYDYLTKTVGNNADIFKNMSQSGKLLENAADISKAARDTLQAENALADVEKSTEDAFTEGIRRRADELAAMNAEGYKPPVGRHTAEEIAGLNTNPVEANNSQFNALMDEFNGQFKDTSAMRNVYNPEDLNASLNNQLRQAMDDYRIPEMENPKVEMELPVIERNMPSNNEIKGLNDELSNMWGNSPKSVEQAVETAQNVKNNYGRIELPEEVTEKGASDFQEIYDSLENMRKVAEASGDEKVLAKFDKLSKSVNDYENAFFKNESEDALISAKKATDAARQSFIREVKKTNPNYTGELTGTKLGNAAYRRTSMKADEQATQELVDSIIETEKELGENNRWVRDAVPETQNPLRGVNPSAENAAESLSKEMDNAAKTQQPRNFEIKELHDKKGRSRYQVVERISENMTQPVEAGKTYKTIDEANEAVYNLKNGNMNLQTFAGDASGAEPNLKVSETYTNTGKRGGGWTEAEYEAHTNPNNYLYETIDEAQSVERATQMRNTEGREAFKNRALYSDRLSSVELDGLMMEWRQLTEEARALEAAGKRADTKWLESNKIFRKIQEQSTDNAQALQALAKWSRNTPEGMLVNAENIINGKAKANKGELQKAIDKLLKTNKGGVEFSPEFERDFIKTATPLMDLKGTELDGREAREIMAKLGKMVNEQIPVKWPEKLTTILMDNMLGNFRTLITRNAGGNVGLNAVEQLVQRPLAAGIDTVLSAKTGKRTQAGLSAAGLKEYVEGFTKGISDEVADLKSGIKTARSGENTLENAIKNNRRVFKTKIANGLDGLVKSGLSVGDRPFYEGVYKQTLGDYQRLRDRGVLGDAIQGLSDQDFKLYSETAAKLNALGAVYQQDTVLSKALLEFKQAVGDLSRGTIGVDILSQFSMPFVKTPANVIERAIDYSPLGLVRNTFRTGKELSQGAFDQNRFANETARNILGTTLMGGGAAMAANGALSGKYSENKNEKQAQKESGMQEYAWNVPEEIPGIGGKQMDISWAPVVGSNLVAAAAAYDAYKNGNDDLVNNLAAGATAGGQALFNQSMFQGLQRLFGTGESYNSDEGIVANMGNVVKSGLSQAIPSLVRQAAQVKDPYQRDLAYSNKGTTFGPLEAYDINSLANNIPGLREDYLAPKVNSQGELMKENQGRSIPMKILEDMILPGKITEVTSNRLNDEAKRLSKITTNASAYMPKPDRQYVDTEEHTLTNDEWTEYRQRYGKEMTSAGEKLLDSDFYKNADDATKEKYLSGIYSDVRSAINSEYTGNEVDGASKVYKEAGGGDKGVEAVVNFYGAKDIMNKNDISSSSNAGKAIKEAALSGDFEKAQKIAEDTVRSNEILEKYDISSGSNAGKEIKAAIEAGKPREAEMIAKKAKEVKVEEAKQKETQETLSDYGLKKTSSAKTYEKAKSEIPGLTTQQFATTYKAIDSDHNEGIKQDEIIDYLNSNNVSEADAQKIWSAYGNKTWKAIPVLKNGKWSKGKR